MLRKECIIVAGPTAVGKTVFAIDLAEQYNTFIISADSRQLYRELNIGVARPSLEELKRVKHYCIASHSITENVSAASFARLATMYLEELFKSHDTVVICGGTGLYIKALTEGLDEIPETPSAIREAVNEIYASQGLEGLIKELDLLDPSFKAGHDINNPRRVMRALEVVMHTGLSIQHFQKGINLSSKWKEMGIDLKYIIMNLPREILYARINARVDQMITAGLEEEALSLKEFSHLPALQTVGYSEFFDFFSGKITRVEAIEKIKQHTRNYAKRQITWFNKVKSNLTEEMIYKG
jgi:tRNA dimethylallyltransferase